MRIIGLTGYARSGKDTIAEIISQQVDSCRRSAFADRIKVSAAKSLGVKFGPDDVGLKAVRAWADKLKTNQRIVVLDENGDQVHSISGRAFLQRFGSEAHRDLFGEDFWLEVMDFSPDVDVLVITDVRFKNEAQKIRLMGGEVWQITRPGTTAGDHISETKLPESLIDVWIANDGTIEQLVAKVSLGLEIGRASRGFEEIFGRG